MCALFARWELNVRRTAGFRQLIFVSKITVPVHARKAYWGLEIYFQSFLVWELDGMVSTEWEFV